MVLTLEPFNLDFMKKNYALVLIAIFSVIFPFSGKAQYTSIVNQAANLLQTAAIGGMRYKGYVDASYVNGFGNLQANFLGVSTVQGMQYADWFFMGAGLGVDVVFSNTENRYTGPIGNRGTKTCGVMIPVFTDFRFNLGSSRSTSCFIDVKAGGSFLIGGDYLAIENGYINGSEYFMLKPTVGVRLPVSETGKKAVNIGLTYQLLTCNYWWYNNNSSGTLNSIGATVSYEW